MLVGAFLFSLPCEAVEASKVGGVVKVPSVLAGKFSFVDDIFGGFSKSGGRYVGPTYRYAQQEERRGERGFFYYVFQTLLRIGSGCFLAYHAGTFVNRISRKKEDGIATVVAIGGFVFSLIFPWIGFFIGAGCMGLSALAKESSKKPPAR